MASVAKPGHSTSASTFVLAVFVLSRLLFMGVGALAVAILPRAIKLDLNLREAPGILNYWALWDGVWYSVIATQGYLLDNPTTTAFFPVFPLMVRAGTALGGGPALWGVLISLVATAFGMYFLYRIAEKLYGVKAARAAVLTFAFFPMAFFLNAVYTEAMFVALTAGSFWAAYVRRNLLLAGFLGALATATRNTGVLLLIPLVYEWLRHRQEFGWRGMLGLALVPSGLVGYITFLWIRFGDPLIFAHQQRTFGRALTDPGTALMTAWVRAGEGARWLLDPAALFLDPSFEPSLGAYNAVSVGFLVLLILLVGASFVLLPPGLAVYASLSSLIPILTPPITAPLMGLPRFMLGTFPLFLILGFILSRSRPALYLWLLISGGLGVAFTALFVTWRVML
jgi:hypothetical protein